MWLSWNNGRFPGFPCWSCWHCKVSVWAYRSSTWMRLTRWGQRWCPVWATSCSCPGVTDHSSGFPCWSCCCWSLLYSTILCSQTHCAHVACDSEWVTHFLSHVFEYPLMWCTYCTVWLFHGWCHMKPLPAVFVCDTAFLAWLFICVVPYFVSLGVQTQ